MMEMQASFHVCFAIIQSLLMEMVMYACVFFFWIWMWRLENYGWKGGGTPALAAKITLTYNINKNLCLLCNKWVGEKKKSKKK